MRASRAGANGPRRVRSDSVAPFRRGYPRTERLSGLDGVAGRLAGVADRAARGAGVKSLLSGSWLGHPLHPLATDAVIGSWTMAAILDLMRGEDDAARTLVGVGVSRMAFAEQLPHWTRLTAPTPLGGGWSTASVGGLPVLARLREEEATRVVSAVCTHCGAALLPDAGGAGAVRCSADGSVFSADDGSVLEGPAPTPIPCFETRLSEGDGVDVRSRRDFSRTPRAAEQ